MSKKKIRVGIPTLQQRYQQIKFNKSSHLVVDEELPQRAAAACERLHALFKREIQLGAVGGAEARGRALWEREENARNLPC